MPQYAAQLPITMARHRDDFVIRAFAYEIERKLGYRDPGRLTETRFRDLCWLEKPQDLLDAVLQVMTPAHRDEEQSVTLATVGGIELLHGRFLHVPVTCVLVWRADIAHRLAEPPLTRVFPQTDLLLGVPYEDDNRLITQAGYHITRARDSLLPS